MLLGACYHRAYCRCWFFPDAVVVLCDWLSLILGEILESGDTSRSLKMLRFSKMGRLLRIVGVMRMLRVVRIMEEFAAVYITEGYRLMFRMVNLTISILWRLALPMDVCPHISKARVERVTIPEVVGGSVGIVVCLSRRGGEDRGRPRTRRRERVHISIRAAVLASLSHSKSRLTLT